MGLYGTVWEYRVLYEVLWTVAGCMGLYGGVGV